MNFLDELIEETIRNLKGNNMQAFYVETKEEAMRKVLGLIPENSTIGFGGSESLKEIKIFQNLKKKSCRILDWVNVNSKEESLEIRRNSFFADFYLSSANAVTQDGKLVNVDGNGNRVAAIAFGPKKVIIVAGKNKLVKNEEEAIERIKNHAAPKNAERLNKETPCRSTKKCMDCRSADRICCVTAITGWQRNKGRIVVILVNEDLGY